MKKLTITLLTLLMSMGAWAEISHEAQCKEALKAVEIFQPLPRMLDEITELVDVSVDCDKKTNIFSKRLLVDESELESMLTKDWETILQRHSNLLNCHLNGIPPKLGWSVKYVFTDKDYEHLTTHIITPEDCN